MDTATYIGREVKSIMQLIGEIDPFLPDEDLVEVLIGAVTAWGTIEAQVLFPALEAAFEGSEPATALARERLNTLYSLHNIIHEEVEVMEPFHEVARRYIDAVKYHLVVDVQEFAPLSAQLPPAISTQLASSMAAMRLDLE